MVALQEVQPRWSYQTTLLEDLFEQFAMKMHQPATSFPRRNRARIAILPQQQERVGES